MRTYVAASAALSLILITGCTQSIQAANLEEDRAAFQNTLQEYAAALKSADYPKIQSFYAPDVSIYAPGMPVIRGLPAVQELQQSDKSDHSKDMFELFSENIQVATAGDIAYTTGTYRLWHSDGRATDSGKFVAIWRKQAAGNWALVEDVFNPDVVSNPAP
jgi:ketosteroid isomerase-like protein